MIFEKLVRIPNDRIAVLIGKSGSVKSQIEKLCRVMLEVDGETGEVLVSSTEDDAEKTNPFKAVEIVMAVGRGFSPEVAMTLLKDQNTLHIIDLKEFAGRSKSGIERIKGRLIGEGGRARRNMENLSGTRISIYGKTVSVIGSVDRLRLAVDAVSSISNGSMHGAVYGRLEAANRRTRKERMILWEDQNVFD